jgi:hypothetical protein
VSRLILAVVFLVAGATARAADDDEHLLETPPPQGIPERMEELEREWAEDVGEKQTDVEVPEPAPLDEAHDAARGADEAPDPDVPTTVPQPEAPPAPKKSTTLESPLQHAKPERPTVRGMPPAPPKEGAAEAPAKRAPHAPTAAEE